MIGIIDAEAHVVNFFGTTKILAVSKVPTYYALLFIFHLILSSFDAKGMPRLGRDRVGYSIRQPVAVENLLHSALLVRKSFRLTNNGPYSYFILSPYTRVIPHSSTPI